ncbi:MAG: alpha/beta hydrolase [Pseudonocardia sp.]|nr:alpha/beta hydrolase [Pseudonocardia sp.]
MTTHPHTESRDRRTLAVQRLELGGLIADSYGVDDDRAPLVLLHGLTYSRSTWAPVRAELERVDPSRRVLALDLPGHGESPSRTPHSIEHVIALVHDAVTEAGLREPVVVGHSLSGGLALVYGAAHSVRGIVSIDSPPDEFIGFARQLRAMEAQLRSPAFDEIWAGLRAGFRLEVLPAPLRELVDATSTPCQELALSYWQEVFDSSDAHLRPMLARVGHELERRGVPVLLLLGHEPSPALAPFLAGMLARARVLAWPGTGHFPHLARLPQFAELLADTAHRSPTQPPITA